MHPLSQGISNHHPKRMLEILPMFCLFWGTIQRPYAGCTLTPAMESRAGGLERFLGNKRLSCSRDCHFKSFIGQRFLEVLCKARSLGLCHESKTESRGNAYLKQQFLFHILHVQFPADWLWIQFMIYVSRRLLLKFILKHSLDWGNAAVLSVLYSSKVLWFSDLQPPSLRVERKHFLGSYIWFWSASCNIYNLNSTHYGVTFENQPMFPTLLGLTL